MLQHIPDVEGHEHTLYRKKVTYDFEAVYFEETGEAMPDFKKTQALGLHIEPLMERTSTIYCTCGEKFRKDKTALEHAKEEGVIEDHKYNPDRWSDKE